MIFFALIGLVCAFFSGLVLGSMFFFGTAQRYRMAAHSWEQCFRSSRGF